MWRGADSWCARPRWHAKEHMDSLDEIATRVDRAVQDLTLSEVEAQGRAQARAHASAQVHYTPYTMNHKPCTLNPTRYTLNHHQELTQHVSMDC